VRITATRLPGVMLAETDVRTDSRGAFARLYCETDLAALVGTRHIAQINQSTTLQRGAVRGLHYQRSPHAEMKLIRCVQGAAWDVAVDLRADSPTFLKWQAVEISRDNARMVIVPEGFAHGFQALTPGCELLYLHTKSYDPTVEGGVAWNDRRIAIDWPLPIPEDGGMSDRDRGLPSLPPDFGGLTA